MISTENFYNSETSHQSLVKSYHKIDKIKALNFLNSLDQQNCKNKKEIDDLLNTITEKLKNIQVSIPTKKILNINVSLPESTRLKIKKGSSLPYGERTKTKS